MLCFTNAAVHVNPDYRVIFPPAIEYGVQHGKHEFVLGRSHMRSTPAWITEPGWT